MDWDILGHQWAVQLLQGHINQDRLRQAYLLAGPPGIGRRTLALRFAQALNCSEPPGPGEYCGACDDCRRQARLAHPDLAILQAEEDSNTIKVDQIRELQHGLALAPYQSRYRVALLLRFEQANPNAANALLKTLEEPPGHVVLILTADSAEALLPTIVSRCEVVRLGPVAAELIRKDLEQTQGLDPELAGLCAQLSAGRPGYARFLAGNPGFLEQRRRWLDDQAGLLGSGRAERFAYAGRFSKDRDDLRQTLQVWISLWHDVLLRAAGAEGPLTNPDRQQEIEGLADRLQLERAFQTVRALECTLALVEGNVNRRLAAEVLMLDLPYLPGLKPPAGFQTDPEPLST